MITDLRGRMDEDSENFNKELEIILKKNKQNWNNKRGCVYVGCFVSKRIWYRLE